jgi:hypothetical protein
MGSYDYTTVTHRRSVRTTTTVTTVTIVTGVSLLEVSAKKFSARPASTLCDFYGGDGHAVARDR